MRKLFLVLGAALFLWTATSIVPVSAQQIHRTQLPIPDTQYKYPGKVPLAARDAKFPPIKLLRPPEGAPNVIVVLLDDIGFGAPSTFGGGVNMPTLDALAKSGLRYTQFHTTALCSPTRQALLTGRNHHSVGMGSITELATSAPGNTGMRLNEVATVAEILKLNGYNTAAFGKMHQTPVWETSVSGPFTRWPVGDGFEKFYGFLGGETNQWAPMVFDGVTYVEPAILPATTS
jgi:arylsulfatase A-like enzyme